MCCDTLWGFLRREGVSFKKTVHASEQDRPVARHRTLWRRVQPRLDPARLVFIDETWTKTNMTRTHGWWRRGEPLIAKVPHGHWRTMTFLAALRCDRITAPCVIDGPINGDSFRTYVEQFLVPTLLPGDIVFMDNLLRKAEERTIDAVWQRIGNLLAALPEPNVQTTFGTQAMVPLESETL